MEHKYVYLFSEGNETMRELLGGKGANLAEMVRLGMPVPQGFTVSTEACTRYYEDGKKIGGDILAQIETALTEIEKINGKKFGDTTNPLLVSVRSGARASMPGMMDTVLNLGMNDDVAAGLIAGNPDPKFARFVFDSYRRFIQMFSDVVMEISKKKFEEIIDELKKEKGVKDDIDLDVNDMKALVAKFKAFYKEQRGVDFPADPKVQLLESVKAVFRSWDNPRANEYRRMNQIPYSWGTAVNVQPMVYGNLNNNSGTGVAFTRDPATGAKALFGEYLINAQGEDVVAGVRTPNPIAQLKNDMPEVYAQFVAIAQKLEEHYRDMQDMEFTIENGTLYMLQTRNGKRTAAAALKVAIDLVSEGVITEEEAVLRVEPQQLDALLHPQFDSKALKSANPIGKALPASPGAACGRVVFTAADAAEWAGRGEKVVLCRLETSPDDIKGMAVSEGILTVRGGMTSHAAVVARGMGTCCVSGCGEIEMHMDEKYFLLAGKKYSEGDYISLDGSTGKIYGEAIKTVDADLSGDFGLFMSWADAARTMKVRTNADTPADTIQAVKFGAEGIGLCRTEHMFFGGNRIKSMRKMIVARTLEAREAALAEILPFQQQDFTEMYEALEARPMTVRFLDPPLHEFLPSKANEIADLAVDLGMTAEELAKIVESLHEVNPMMGHRGCRLAVSYPEIAKMQTTAVINAALAVTAAHPEYNIVPEIMIPLVGEIKELKYVKDIVTSTADALIAAAGSDMHYKVGTMIEIPRAAVLADQIATEAEFFSFGTNDLTQMTFGFSRDDAGKFLQSYYDTKIFEDDPFERLDQIGVGKLIEVAVSGGRKTRPDIKLGICGEHGGDPSSVKFCFKLGLDYVSCSPFRVPIAKLAAAQAAIAAKK
ncbi:MAG: pyruvate, phosphate dikinase [Oscillospiraceae bacterium]|jgi:pyruvate,orthophosphate dikinase|nr:pyruvate, phosphate dikinase [Oscillospiraceae bacterium]